jgi:exosortase family protein XrtM
MAGGRIDPRVIRAVLFGAVFLAAAGLHYLLKPQIAPTLNRDINARSAAFLIGVITPSEGVTAHGYDVGTDTASVQVRSGCDGLDALLMLLAAVVVFPMSTKRKLIGVLLGTGLIYTLNVMRIAGLWYCVRYRPEWFETMHVTVGQTILIVASVLFFATLTGAFSGALQSAR